jgi:bacillithiol biosynthesis cysteine-adding enzyme BshC
LFADVLYHPDRTAAFYRHPVRDLEAYRAAASEVRISDEHRAALVSALRSQNPDSPALERLAQPGTVAVATGQQVGLFSGPAYTIYKALHAARLAEWLTANGIPAVPMFWIATEDHDFAEVNHVWVFGMDHRPRKLEMRRSASSQPVGEVPLSDPPVRELRNIIQDLPYGDRVTQLVERTYLPGATMGHAFAALLRNLLAEFDILQVDPMQPAFRELAAPVMRAALESAPDLNAGILERNRRLAASGYHAQVHVEEQTSLLFLLENGKRLTLRRHGREYILNGRRFTTEELMDRAQSLSPNALLRPVVQDGVLPTVATIGGPAELAYFAQSEVIYRTILKRMPVTVPRTGYTIIDSRSQKLMERYRLGLPDFFQGEDALRERVALRLVPPALHSIMQESASSVEASLVRLRETVRGFDPTLVTALERSGRKIAYQMQKMERKIGRESLRRDRRATDESASLDGLIYPGRNLQERVYSILPLMAKHGPELIQHIYDSIQLDCPDHRIMVV